jgi:hypothetical protein
MGSLQGIESVGCGPEPKGRARRIPPASTIYQERLRE